MKGRGVRTMVGSARMLYKSSHTSRQAACCFALDAAKECKYTCTSHYINKGVRFSIGARGTSR